MQENGQTKKHVFYSEGRDGIRISGVCEVESFDESGVSLETLAGSMAIEGEGLKVTTLNTDEGIVEITGKLNGVYYYDNKPTLKRGLFGRRSDT